MKIYDLENNKVLDIVMKSHRKNLDLKYNDSHIMIADQTSKSVIVSSVDESLLNYDVDVKISKSVSHSKGNPFKGSYYKNEGSKSNYEGPYKDSSQGTGHFGKKITRKSSLARNKKSILASNGMNLIRTSSYTKPVEKDPYTNKKYDFSDFDDLTPKPQGSMASPYQPASPPTINAVESREIISKITNNHSKIMQLMKNRKSKLWNLQQFWTSGNTIKTLKTLLQ